MGVKLNTSRYRGFGLPSPVLFPAVHTLSLTRVCSVWGWSDLFSPSNLPLLRKLCLKDCRGTYDLNINFPGLEILELDGLRLKGLDISGTGLLELQVTRCLRPKGRAKILAPNLRRLYWEDNFNVKCGTQSFEDLNTGSVYFPSKPPNPATLQSAAAFISALCFARSLSVRSQVFKILSSMDSEDGLPFCFNNLTTLEIHTHLTKYGATGIICLLRRSPILHSINIRVDCSKLGNKSWDDDRYWPISELKYQVN
ncbi:uncharacterized protein LOC131330595 [Rhododendron vialii]|uniref:uncharacterized protein LOC131330595 n=1 Tax=Rhododendron vialii TaxID=182163 RepID=UPI00265F921A|nr:uncharacterized protein LOC131330595 [Rhododendron vialii]